jgi:hypothetical protein
MSETLAAPAPAAPAPAASPAPVTAPAAAPAATAAPVAPAPVFGGHGSTPTSHVDPSKFPIREDYARELLREKLAAVPAAAAAADAEKTPATETAPVTGADPAAAAAPVVEVPAPDAAKPVVKDEAAEEDFRLDPPIVIATPEVMSRLATEKPEFGKLLEADKELKGALFKTAREAAEVKPYKEIFADVAAAKHAHAGNATWTEVRKTFEGATTREGTVKALAQIAELSYERDDKGEVVMRNGKPVIGEDFYGFTENLVAMDHEHQVADIKQRLEQNLYRTDAERAGDERLLSALEIVVESARPVDALAELPADLKRRAEDVERREQAQRTREQGDKVKERSTFDSEMRTVAQDRLTNGIKRILDNVEKQGAYLSPYLKKTLPRDIASRVIKSINANQGLLDQMALLQQLPVGPDARARRTEAIDRGIQEYLHDVAREELRDAGVQITSNAAGRKEKIDGQVEATRTEPRGSTAPSMGGGGVAVPASAAFDAEEAAWRTANPGRPFDKVARESILSNVLARMTGAA